ncbi:hypothetical protein KCP70_17770 [Salmonella enterica subsp. enterica]|nr:hypothetical protein KCP70_17770 [Salmonella enterica subsp. enterica]
MARIGNFLTAATGTPPFQQTGTFTAAILPDAGSSMRCVFRQMAIALQGAFYPEVEGALPRCGSVLLLSGGRQTSVPANIQPFLKERQLTADKPVSG